MGRLLGSWHSFKYCRVFYYNRWRNLGRTWLNSLFKAAQSVSDCSKNRVTKRLWEELGGWGIKLERKAGARHADHVKDSEQECANSRKLRRGQAGSRLHFSKFPSSVLWTTDHVGPVWIQGDLCGWYHSGWPLWEMMELLGPAPGEWLGLEACGRCFKDWLELKFPIKE